MKVGRRKAIGPTPGEDAETVVISFRAPLELAKRLDELAEYDHRNRANFILTTLVRATSEELVRSGGFWLKAFHQSYAKDPVGRETEFWRGQIAGWKRTLVTCRRVTITRLLASKLSWLLAAKSCSPSNSSPI